MFAAGETVYLPGGSGEPSALVESVFGVAGIHIVTSFVPGVNALKPEWIGAGTRVTGLFMQASLAAMQREGRFRHLPISYAGMVKWLNVAPPVDACVVQVTPPDADGLCSLGPAAEFTPGVLGRAKRVVAIVNPRVPRLSHSPSLRLSACDTVVEADLPVVGYDVGPVDTATETIAQLVAGFIGNGAVLQVGLGKVPHALMRALVGRRDLRLHSGMISDGVIALHEAGALDAGWPHTTTALLGSERLYAWAAETDFIHVRGSDFTHNPQVLGALDGFVAVNSALEVDLFGQCNLELANGRAVSGGGGASDFAAAARRGTNGISIVALPATFGGGKGSRIRARLGADSIATLPRTDVDIVVTEEGAADLRGRSVHERAEALTGIAMPAVRGELMDRWREIAGRL